MANFNDSADIFANSSNDTIKENEYLDFMADAKKPSAIQFMDDSHINEYQSQVYTSSPLSPQSRTFPEGDISFIANQFISEACNVPVVLYCPFCPFTCHFEFIFKDHVKNAHPSDIMTIVKSKRFYFEFHACPFCHAKFYVRELLPKHVLAKHVDSVVFRGLGRNNYVQCRFCSVRLMGKHLKRLIMHVEKKHMADLENFLQNQNTNVTLSSKDMKFFCDDIEIISTSGLNKNIDKPDAQDSERKICRVKSILKPVRNSPHLENTLNPNQSTFLDTPNNGSYEAIRIQNSARRKLRFDIPDSVDENKENVKASKQPVKDKSNKVKWFSLFKKERRPPTHLSSPVFKPFSTPPKTPCEKTSSFFTKFHLEHDGVSPLMTNHFKCGLCHDDFENNAQLLNHLQLQHRGISLTAQYQCGACNAKFYRNSYLVRHCWYHHTPLCLKKTGLPDQNL